VSDFGGGKAGRKTADGNWQRTFVEPEHPPRRRGESAAPKVSDFGGGQGGREMMS